MFKTKNITEKEFKDYYQKSTLPILLKSDKILSLEELKNYFFDLVRLAKTYGYNLPFMKITDEELLDMIEEVEYSL